MEIGAVLITAGCGSIPAMPSGGVTVTQRMIASLKKAEVSLIAVVTGPEDRKFEKQLAQPGVVFLHNPASADMESSIRMGLHYLAGKCTEVFLMEANHPLVTPETFIRMRHTPGNPVVPVYRGTVSQIMLLRDPFPAIHDLREIPSGTILNVEDPGVLLTADESEMLTEAIGAHDRMLTRPVLDFSIARDKPVVDGRLVMLLHLIEETQSVRDACGRMQISYSAAWNILNGAEDSLGYPLVQRNKGGPSGSGTVLTEKATQLLWAYDQFEAHARDNIQQLYDVYLSDVL